MKSLKLVMIAGLAILICAIAAAARQTNNTQAVYINNIQKEGAVDIECAEHLTCPCCIPVNQPY